MILFTSSQVGEVLQRLHDSEINILFSTYWNGGIDFEVGSHSNMSGTTKFRATLDFLKEPQKWTIEAVLSDAALAAVARFPNSDFAKWYNAQCEPKAASNAREMTEDEITENDGTLLSTLRFSRP